jgi:hypothetical protein
MKRYSIFFVVATAVVGVALFSVWKRTAAQGHVGPRVKDYLLEAEGAEGVRLNLVLVYKPTADESPVMENRTITIPCSTRFSADKCYAWFDNLPEDDGGREGDRYRVVLSINGQVKTSVELIVQHGRRKSGSLGDM